MHAEQCLCLWCITLITNPLAILFDYVNPDRVERTLKFCQIVDKYINSDIDNRLLSFDKTDFFLEALYNNAVF